MEKKIRPIRRCAGRWEGMETLGKYMPAGRSNSEWLWEGACAGGGSAKGPLGPVWVGDGARTEGEATLQATDTQLRRSVSWQRAGGWAEGQH